ncbi:MAG: type I methionyl aminopeptidase [bacterium]
MIPIKTPADLVRMRASCRLTATLLQELMQRIVPGVTTAELDVWAAARILEMGGRSAFKGYHGYPGHVCMSVNDEVVHGIPGPRRIQIGDLVSVDVGIVYDGFVGDTAGTVMVGVTDPEIVRLANVTKAALAAGIAAARVDARVGDISHAVEQVVVAAGFSVVRSFVGHGVGRVLHEEPQVPNYGLAGHGPKLRAGMTLAIEPMVNAGLAEVKTLADGWTVVTVDGRPSAHFEHTVAIGPDGPEVLT